LGFTLKPAVRRRTTKGEKRGGIGISIGFGGAKKNKKK
jgi:hypothetical protein